jgi:transcriptional regulator with XRE-family HTH domain
MLCSVNMTELHASDTVAVKIRQARQRRNWSQAELGSRCGLSGDVIQHIESGRRGADGRRRRDITVDELLAIGGALEMSVSDLLPPAALRPHRSERERAVSAALSAIEHEQVKMAALQEVLMDFERQQHKILADMDNVQRQMTLARQNLDQREDQTRHLERSVLCLSAPP